MSIDPEKLPEHDGVQSAELEEVRALASQLELLANQLLLEYGESKEENSYSIDSSSGSVCIGTIIETSDGELTENTLLSVHGPENHRGQSYELLRLTFSPEGKITNWKFRDEDDEEKIREGQEQAHQILSELSERTDLTPEELFILRYLRRLTANNSHKQKAEPGNVAAIGRHLVDRFHTSASSITKFNDTFAEIGEFTVSTFDMNEGDVLTEITLFDSIQDIRFTFQKYAADSDFRYFDDDVFGVSEDDVLTSERALAIRNMLVEAYCDAIMRKDINDFPDIKTGLFSIQFAIEKYCELYNVAEASQHFYGERLEELRSKLRTATQIYAEQFERLYHQTPDSFDLTSSEVKENLMSYIHLGFLGDRNNMEVKIPYILTLNEHDEWYQRPIKEDETVAFLYVTTQIDVIMNKHDDVLADGAVHKGYFVISSYDTQMVKRLQFLGGSVHIGSLQVEEYSRSHN